MLIHSGISINIKNESIFGIRGTVTSENLDTLIEYYIGRSLLG